MVLNHCGLAPDINRCVGELFNGKTAAAQLLVDERTFRIRSLSRGMRGKVRQGRLLSEQQDRRQQVREKPDSEWFEHLFQTIKFGTLMPPAAQVRAA